MIVSSPLHLRQVRHLPCHRVLDRCPEERRDASTRLEGHSSSDYIGVTQIDATGLTTGIGWANIDICFSFLSYFGTYVLLGWKGEGAGLKSAVEEAPSEATRSVV